MGIDTSCVGICVMDLCGKEVPVDIYNKEK